MATVSADLLAELGLDPTDPEVQEGVEDAEAVARLLRTLVDVRRRSGLNQTQVAEAMGTTQSAVSDLERTAGDPRVSTLQRFARAVGVKVCLTVATPKPHYVSKVVLPVAQGTGGGSRANVNWRQAHLSNAS